MHSSDCGSGQAGNKSSSKTTASGLPYQPQHLSTADIWIWLQVAESNPLADLRKATRDKKNPQTKTPFNIQCTRQRQNGWTFACLRKGRASARQTALMAEQEEGGVKRENPAGYYSWVADFSFRPSSLTPFSNVSPSLSVLTSANQRP